MKREATSSDSNQSDRLCRAGNLPSGLFDRNVAWGMAMAVVISVGGTVSVHAEEVTSVTQLEGLVGEDRLLVEDFEGISVHGGTGVTVANPLNAETGGPQLGLEPGVTFSSVQSLRLYSTILNGDDSVMLQGAGGDMTIDFDAPQAAVGFYLDGVANAQYGQVITFYHGTTVLETMAFTMEPRETRYLGWHSPQLGITSLHLQTTSSFPGFAEIDELAWGLAPGDANDDGRVDLLDLDLVGTHWQESGVTIEEGDFNRDGTVDLLDLDVLGANWTGSPASFAQAIVATGYALPEPSGLAMVAVTGLLFCRRL